MTPAPLPRRFGAIHEALRALSEGLRGEAVLIVAGWHAPYDPWLGEEAARRVIELIEELDRAQPVELFLYARGLSASFADTLRRYGAPMARCHLLCRTLGASTAVALCAERLVLFAGAGLGAGDVASPRRGAASALDLELYEHLKPGESIFDGEGALHGPLLALLHERRARAGAERALSAVLSRRFGREERERAEALYEALSWQRLGQELGLGAVELERLGVEARHVERGGVEALKLKGLAESCEAHFAVRPRRRSSFGENELGEIEFELAHGEPGAMLATRRSAHYLELDTGSPDPDTGRLVGAWEAFSWEGTDPR